MINSYHDIKVKWFVGSSFGMSMKIEIIHNLLSNPQYLYSIYFIMIRRCFSPTSKSN